MAALPASFDTLAGYLDAGGFVMPPLVAITLVLWYALGARWTLLKRGTEKNVRVLLKRHADGRVKAPRGIVDAAIERGLAVRAAGLPHLRRRLDDAFAGFESDIRRYGATVTATVAVAPLLGLLGTVAGMIETFDSLGDMALFSQSGGIAGGIATALFTTQMGLVVAVPGVICKALLDRRQQRIAADLAQIKDLLTAADTRTTD
jgi:biopolymer transport protein ExbB